MDTKTSQAAFGRDDFEAAAAFGYGIAVKALADLGQVPSLLFAGRKVDGRLQMAFVDDVDLENDADKRRLSWVMETLVSAEGVDMVLHISEAWTLIQPAEQGIPENSIEHHPRRQEAVVFNIRSKDCQTIVNNPLRRDPDRLERGAVDMGLELAGRLARKNSTRH